MNTHLTSINIKNELPLQTGNEPLSNNPAGSASKQMVEPDKTAPEKPDVDEVPPSTDTPEVKEIEIPEVPDAEIPEVPNTDIEEIPETK